MIARYFTPLLLAAVIAGCSSTISSDEPIRPLSRGEASVVDGGNIFGLELLRTLNREEKGENLFISPLSVSMALGMTLNGAVGPTRDSMERTLALAGMSATEINEAYRELSTLLVGLDPAVKFTIANSIWYRNGLSVEQDFTDLARTYFNAAITGLDFKSPDAAPRIDQWVSDNTAGKIPTIAPNPIPQEMVMFLINAIYFKGSWTTTFDSTLTHDAAFIQESGATKNVKMMVQRFPALRQYEGEGVKMAELPYGTGAFSMVIAMPTGSQTLDGLVENLDDDSWKSWIASMKEDEGLVYIPRFTISWAGSLRESLESLGMGIAFSDAADFSKIDRMGMLRISNVRHKTFVEVNEQGTEAAAVTSIDIETTSETGDRKFVLRADRPFIFAIRERKSGTILFVGKMMKP